MRQEEQNYVQVKAELDQAQAEVRDRLDYMVRGLRRLHGLMDPDLMYASVARGLSRTNDPTFLVVLLTEAVMRLVNAPVQEGQS